MSYEEEVAALVIHKTEPDDADVYRCEVSNPLGRVQTEGTLSVHSELCFYQKDEEQLKIRKLISFFILCCRPVYGERSLGGQKLTGEDPSCPGKILLKMSAFEGYN